jgi:predicted  nucleic acid-binding Zn-ribbon protein
MNQRTFLYQLQIIDNELDKNQKRLSEIQAILNYKKDENLIRAEIDKLETINKNKNHELKKISDEASTIQNKKTASEKSLYDGSIKNPKELQSVNQEIESLKNRLSNLDEEQLDLLFQIESLEEQIKSKNNDLDLLLEKKNKQKELLLVDIEKIEKENNKLLVDKKPILSQIEDEYFNQYKKLRKTKNNIAVSQISDNACSMCGNGLPPMEVQRAKSSADEVFCSVCRRFLYSG